ncbi:MAG: rhodanese-like domain-containing protein [Methylococcaceae bacterium]|nr:rhodanese-like domain-containing protein [Methylococcaceae bacterium]
MKRGLCLFAWIFGYCQAGELLGLTPDELQAMENQGALVVDVRTPQEWKSTGIIPGSHALTYFDANGGYDKEGWLKQLKPLMKSPDQALIMVCRSGHRSAMVGRMLSDEAGYSKVYHLEKGIRGWSAESLPLAQP